MTKEPWYESDNPGTLARSVGWRLGVIIIVCLLFFGIIGGVMWAFGVFTSDIKGRGEAVKQKNSASNRISAQENFQQLYNDVLAADKRIDVFKTALDMDPKSTIAQTNYIQAQTYCQSVVADYDASARKFTQRDFRDYDLPEKIDDQDPSTDCAPTPPSN
jgi:hypothetical protein